jgi:hypothetical protein
MARMTQGKDQMDDKETSLFPFRGRAARTGREVTRGKPLGIPMTIGTAKSCGQGASWQGGGGGGDLVVPASPDNAARERPGRAGFAANGFSQRLTTTHQNRPNPNRSATPTRLQIPVCRDLWWVVFCSALHPQKGSTSS